MIGLTLNHENMTDAEVQLAVANYATELEIAVTEPLTGPIDRLTGMIFTAFPELASKRTLQPS